MIALEDCDVYFGKAQVLHNVSIEVGEGKIVSLIGRNGAGKSTILKTLAGLVPVARGRRVMNGEDLTALPAHKMARRGIAFVPEDRRIFINLSVRENLELANVVRRKGRWSDQRVYDLFPVLRERAAQPGNTLSGGEQQMLAIARGLLTNPEVLLLDEPTEGLAPLIVNQLVEAIRIINNEGTAVLLVEQNLRIPMMLADRQYVIDHGVIQWSGTTAEMAENRDRIETLVSL
jgi:branched-chain amino acid transport system ATP-binding protein